MAGIIAGLATIAGPLFVWAAPWLALIPAWATIKGWMRVASYASVLALGAWGGAKGLAWWRGDQITLTEADKRGKAKCEATLAEAELKAREAALSQREASLKQRESEIAADADRLAAYETELEASREKLASDNAPFVGSGDKWLRDWRGKGR